MQLKCVHVTFTKLLSAMLDPALLKLCNNMSFFVVDSGHVLVFLVYMPCLKDLLMDMNYCREKHCNLKIGNMYNLQITYVFDNLSFMAF